MTKEDVKDLLKVIMNEYPKEFAHLKTAEAMSIKVDTWYAGLADISKETAIKALYMHITTNVYPPKIANLRECVSALTVTQSLSADEAWGYVLKSLRDYGYYRMDEGLKYLYSIDERLGNMVKAFGYKDILMSQNIAIERSNFIKLWEKDIQRTKQLNLLPDRLKKQILSLSEQKNMLE